MQQILRLAQRPQHGEHVAALVFRPAASERVPGLYVGARMILQIARDGQLEFMPPYVRLRVMREQRRRHARHAARVHQEIRVAGEHFPDGHIVFVRERIGAEGERGAQIAVLFFGHLRDGAVEQHGPVVKFAVGDCAGARQLVERVGKLVNHLFHHRRRKLPHMAEIPQFEPVGRKPVVGEKAGESAPVLVPAEHPVLHLVQRDILLPVPQFLDVRQPLMRYGILLDQPVGLCGAVGQILRVCKERHGAAARPVRERVIELQLFPAVIEPYRERIGGAPEGIFVIVPFFGAADEHADGVFFVREGDRLVLPPADPAVVRRDERRHAAVRLQILVDILHPAVMVAAADGGEALPVEGHRGRVFLRKAVDFLQHLGELHVERQPQRHAVTFFIGAERLDCSLCEYVARLQHRHALFQHGHVQPRRPGDFCAGHAQREERAGRAADFKAHSAVIRPEAVLAAAAHRPRGGTGLHGEALLFGAVQRRDERDFLLALHPLRGVFAALRVRQMKGGAFGLFGGEEDEAFRPAEAGVAEIFAQRQNLFHGVLLYAF